MENSIKVIVCILAFATILCGVAFAGETGHYPLGVEGIKAATLPPPGKYLRMYNLFYTSNVLRNSSADNSGDGLDLDVLAIAPRFIWITDQKILGADYGMDVLVTLIQNDVELDTPGLKNNDFCYGDLMIEPIDLAWHGERYDIGAAYAVWMPTGKYNKSTATDPLSDLASPGKDFWTSMFTFGGTYYMDQEKTWSASLLNRYEIHSNKDHSDIKPGQNLLFEWGVAKTLAKVWDVGLAGYAQWQLTDDKGSDVTWDKDLHDRVAAIGPEVSVFIPPAKLFVSLRSLWEFSAVDRPEGTTVTLTLTKIF